MNVKPVFEAEERLDLSLNNYDLSAEIRQASPARKVYQPAAEWRTVEFGGKTTFFPPDLPGQPLVAHPALRDQNGRALMVPADGTAEIKDKYGPVFDSKKRKMKAGISQLKGETANDFLLFIGASEKYRDGGFTWLRGDGLDEKRKSAARAIYNVARRKEAEQEVHARAETIANFNKLPQNHGQTPPPPTSKQIEAQEFLDEIRSEGRVGSEFICKHGCYETSDFAKYARHMKVNHAEIVTAPVAEDVASEDDVVADAVKRGPGRPRKTA